MINIITDVYSYTIINITNVSVDEFVMDFRILLGCYRFAGNRVRLTESHM